ncbi:MAG: DUF4097 family beta strand repeat-containing protein [Candidatus Celaenobacter antarcticus]|nr:DUF4097 family beta strand repeat-containing protein [Candidatus Celaenobacter antarcticus]MDP8315552.1 DUF4097 family beta strand repeat-containing protein [Candidatus Celaenobacter antarcticus]
MLRKIVKTGLVVLILSVIIIILSGCDVCDINIKTGKGKVIINGVYLKHKRTIHLEEKYDLSSIKLKVGSGDIDVSGHNQNNISLDVVIYEKEPDDVSVYLKDNLLKTKSVGHHPVYIDSIGGYLPENISLQLSAGSGDIYVINFNSSPKISVSTGSGNNEITNCTNIGNIIADMGSGDIVLDGMENLKHLSTDSGSGDVYVNNSTITDADFETGSGDIKIRNTQFESINADTGSGDVILKNSTYQNGTFDTGSGDVIESRST